MPPPTSYTRRKHSTERIYSSLGSYCSLVAANPRKSRSDHYQKALAEWEQNQISQPNEISYGSIIYPGEYFGDFQALLHNNQYAKCNAIALENTKLVEIPVTESLKFIEVNYYTGNESLD